MPPDTFSDGISGYLILPVTMHQASPSDKFSDVPPILYIHAIIHLFLFYNCKIILFNFKKQIFIHKIFK